jgi:acyl-CoA thioesterase YciA
MTEDANRRDPVLRTVPGPADINTNGNIFGGWVLSQMDIAGGIVAHREAHGPVATVAIDSMAFIAPINLHDLVSVYAWVERRGRSSLAIRIQVTAARFPVREEVVTVTEGVFTFVAIDGNGKPRQLPAA